MDGPLWWWWKYWQYSGREDTPYRPPGELLSLTQVYWSQQPMSSENISHCRFRRHSWIASVGPFCQSVRYLLVLSLRTCNFVIFVCMIHFGVIPCSVPRKCLLLIYNNGMACHINIGMNEQKQLYHDEIRTQDHRNVKPRSYHWATTYTYQNWRYIQDKF